MTAVTRHVTLTVHEVHAQLGVVPPVGQDGEVDGVGLSLHQPMDVLRQQVSHCLQQLSVTLQHLCHLVRGRGREVFLHV